MVRVVVSTAIATALVVPNQALAYDQTLNTPVPTALLEAAQARLFPVTASVAGYSYREAGLVVSTASPVTERAIWPKTRVAPAAVKVPVVRVGGSGLVMEGEASYYSRAGCLGCNPLFIMANGQPLDDGALTMAIGADKKHLVGYHAKVTSLATGKSVIVKITDTGGFYKDKYGNRVADLTIATKQAIGMAGGVGQVRVEIL